MIKKTIEYTDYNGNKKTEEAWFHLNRPECYKIMLSEDCDLEAYMRRIIKEGKGSVIMEFFEKVIAMAYGEKTIDGRGFQKSPQVATAFLQSGAYDALFTELVTNADAAAQFMNGVLDTNFGAVK